MTTSDAFARIESAAHESAFGFGKQPPSKAQCEQSNYKVGRVQWAGLDLCIEQPRHSVREGCSKGGKPWRSLMAAHYGYIAGTKGADGDAVDCFIGPSVASGRIFVVNQGFAGSFDEHKVMLCFDNEEAARSAYMSSYTQGWAGLQTVIECSLAQLKWWLKHADMSQPMNPKNLPHEGGAMKPTHWTQDALPVGTSLDALLYDLRRHDGSDGLLMDAVTIADIESDPENQGVLTLDGLTTPYQRVERTMSMLQKFMDRVDPELTVMQMQVSSPFKRQGTVNVAVVYELSDGQTVSVYLHNPDTTPSKLAPLDELISWKWLLNKKDVTIVVAPERGVDLNVREVARRLMRVAKKNTAAFARANSRRAENVQAVESLKEEVLALEGSLAKFQTDLEVAKLQAEERAVRKPAGGTKPPAPEPTQEQDTYLPEGWSESTPGGMATKVGDDGGIVDFAPGTGKWFVVFNREGLQTAEGFATRRAAFDFLAATLAALGATNPEPSQSENCLITAMVESARTADGGIARIATSDHFTFSFEGDEVVVDEQLRAQVEAALGEPLVEATLPGLEGQVSLVAKSKSPQAVQEQLYKRAGEISDTLKGWGFAWLGAFRTDGTVRVFYSAADINPNRGEIKPHSRFMVRGPGSTAGVPVDDSLDVPVSTTIQQLADAIQLAKGAEPVVPKSFQEWISTIPEGPATVEAMSLAAGKHGGKIEWYVPGQMPMMDSANGLVLDSAFAHAIAALAITAQIAANNAPLHSEAGDAAQAQLSEEVAESARKAQEVLATLDAESVQELAGMQLDDAGTPANVCGSVMLKGQLLGLVEIDADGMANVYRGNSVATPVLPKRTMLAAAARAVHMLMEEAVKAQEDAGAGDAGAGEGTQEPTGPSYAEGAYLKAEFPNVSKLSTLQEYLHVKSMRTAQLVQVQKVLRLSEAEYDDFANNLMADRTDLGKGGTATDSPLITQEDMERGFSQLSPEQAAEWKRTSYRLGTVVMAPNRATIVVDPQGHRYARYVGLNPVPAAAPELAGAGQPEKVKRATKKEVRDLYDSIAWSINDLMGHTPSELLRAHTKNLSDKMEQAKAMLERGMPKDMGGVPDLASAIERGQQMIDRIQQVQADREAAISLLTGIADGTTSGAEVDIDALIELGQKYAGDLDIQSLLAQATAAIQAYELAATNALN